MEEITETSAPAEDVRLPLLSPSEWLRHVDTDDTGIILPNPFDGFLPPVVTGRFTLIGAPTEGGKTILCMQHFVHCLDRGVSGAFLTTEMNPKDLFERMTYQFAGSEEAREWVLEHEAHISENFISITEIETVMKSRQFDLIVLDHLHDLPYSERIQLEAMVDRLSSLAVSKGFALLAAGQLRRPDPQFYRPPSKHDFKDSGKFEQEAALIFAIEQEDPTINEYNLWTLKNRYGPKPDPLPVRLDPSTLTFRRI